MQEIHFGYISFITFSTSLHNFIVKVNVKAIQIRTHKFPKPGPEYVLCVLGFSKMVPERDHRRDHLDLMGRSHPLRSLALECVWDNPRDRPSALKICNKMERVKESKEYKESQHLALLKVHVLVLRLF